MLERVIGDGDEEYMVGWLSRDAWLPRLLERGAERYSMMRASDIVVEG